MSSLVTFGLLVLAVSTGTLTITKSVVFDGFRKFCNRRIPFVGEMLKCPYCAAHWVSLLYTSLSWDVIPAMTNYPIVNVFLVALAVVPLTVPLIVMMYEKIPILVQED